MKRWTKEEIDYLIKLFNEQKSTKEIAKIVNLDFRRVDYKLQMLGLHQSKQWSQKEIKYIKENKELLTLEEIALNLGRTRSAIQSKISKLGIGNEINRVEINKDYFETIDNKEKAYWLGFLMADGSVTCPTKNGNPRRLSLSLQVIDKSHIVKFINAIDGKGCQIKHFMCKQKSGRETEQCRVDINSEKLATDLCDKGCIPNKTYECKSNPILDDSLFKHYLRGYFDGDGCFYFNHKLKNRRYRVSFEITCHNKEQMEEIVVFLNKYDIVSRVCDTGDGNYRLMATGIHNIRKLLDFLYEDTDETIRLDRKYDKYNYFKKVMPTIVETL